MSRGHFWRTRRRRALSISADGAGADHNPGKAFRHAAWEKPFIEKSLFPLCSSAVERGSESLLRAGRHRRVARIAPSQSPKPESTLNQGGMLPKLLQRLAPERAYETRTTHRSMGKIRSELHRPPTQPPVSLREGVLYVRVCNGTALPVQNKISGRNCANSSQRSVRDHPRH